MSAAIIDGKAIAKDVRNELKEQVLILKKKGITPGIAVVLVGNDPASEVYVRNKQAMCAKIGIHSFEHRLPETTSSSELLDLVTHLNQDNRVHGILVQSPLPKGLDENTIFAHIRADKDVDGFNPVNLGRLVMGLDGFVACTPKGILEMLDRSKVELKGKRAVIVGRSVRVGKPLAFLLLARHATVTLCHSRTADLPGECRSADILVVAIGQSELVRGDWIKPGAVVVDVGVNRIESNGETKLVGDVCFEEAEKVASQITPVPGGVGPMTIAMLLANTVRAAQLQEI